MLVEDDVTFRPTMTDVMGIASLSTHGSILHTLQGFNIRQEIRSCKNLLETEGELAPSQQHSPSLPTVMPLTNGFRILAKFPLPMTPGRGRRASEGPFPASIGCGFPIVG